MAIIETDQSKDIHLTEFQRGQFFIRYASYRKGEDALLDLRSEDYVVTDVTPSRLLFCLSDGVGSSFYGNIGSQILSEIVLSFLNESYKEFVAKTSDWVAELDIDELSVKLEDKLKQSINFATSYIENKDIYTGKNEQISLAEKSQRDDVGSQANFVAGIVIPRSKNQPNGFLLLFWLGNARVRLFNASQEITSETDWGMDPNQEKEVWSTKYGPIGMVHGYSRGLPGITNVIVYSDGLENVEPDIRPDMGIVEIENISKRSQSVKDDDVSFFEITNLDDLTTGDNTDDICLDVRERLSDGIDKSITSVIEVNKSLLQEKLIKHTEKYKRLVDLFKRSNKEFRLMLIIFSIAFFLAGFLLSEVAVYVQRDSFLRGGSYDHGGIYEPGKKFHNVTTEHDLGLIGKAEFMTYDAIDVIYRDLF